MFDSIRSQVPKDGRLPDRVHDLEVRKRVLDGTLYNVLPYEFHYERERAGRRKPIPLEMRRPCVLDGINLIKTTVLQHASFVFGEGRFPDLNCNDQTTQDALTEFAVEQNLPELLQTAVIMGSVGSVALMVHVSKTDKVYVRVVDTQYLTPTWDADEPDKLIKVTEKFIKQGWELAAEPFNYPIAKSDMMRDFWWMREWDANEETWYIPWLAPAMTQRELQDKSREISPVEPQRDGSRSVQHNLNVCPWVWIQNTGRTGSNEIDGSCTFLSAIPTCIQIDYLLSQEGRGLKYSADPQLFIKSPVAPNAEISRSASSAIIADKDGDAKILEINGSGMGAIDEHTSKLREHALESMHGHQASPDRGRVPQSGAAQKLLWQPVLMFAANLRDSYGSGGLLDLCKLVTQISQVRRLLIRGKEYNKLSVVEPVGLIWHEYFDPSNEEIQMQAATLIQLQEGRLLSKETAVSILANTLDIVDVQKELAMIASDIQDAIKILSQETAVVQAQTRAPE